MLTHRDASAMLSSSGCRAAHFFAWALVLTLPATASAQNVSVTPDGSPVTRTQNTSGHTATFAVTNLYSQTTTWNLVCTTTGPVTCTGTSASQVTLAFNQSTQVTATYNVGAAGSGVLSLRAYSGVGTDEGTYNVTVTVPPVYGVAVTPDGDSTAAHPPNTSGYTEIFTIKNTGNTSDTYAISCGGTTPVTCTGKSATSVPLAAGASTTVTANYSVGAVGVGTLTLTAASANASNGGSYTVPVRVLTAQAPSVAVDSINPGPLVERDQCLTIALGPAAAAECGDLRVVHALPTTRTLNKARTPTLLYNSALAHPHPIVRANVTLPGTASVPTRFDAKLWNCATPGGCTLLASGSWNGSDWWPGRTRQIALGYDAVPQGQGTGLYTQTIEVIAVYTGSSFSVARTLQVAIVDRRTSPFGAGWWLAGLEQLNVGTKVWVGGDGSVRQYSLVSGQTSIWVAPSIDYPDTLKLIGNNYIRYLPHRVQVGFDLSGKHVFTVNRLSDTTRFAYSGTSLSTITLPPASLGRTYQVTYPTGQVVITAPGDVGVTRTTTLTLSTGRLTQVRDPDNATVTFGYDATTVELLVSRTDRLGHVVNYAYDAGQKVASSTQVMGGGQPSIVRGLAANESRGITGTAAVDSGKAYTRVDGPRTDVADSTTFLVTRYGAPRRIVDALGNATQLIRGDSRWPGLVTLMIAPNGRKQSAVYDTRGNLVSATDSSTSRSGTFATTQYVWDGSCDEVTHIALPEGEVTDLSYDAVNCNRLWQQDTRGSASRVNFTYYTSGIGARRLATITTPMVPATSIAYDGYGNLRSVTSPRGIITTSYKDAFGRDTLVVSPIDSAATKFQRQRIYYDLMDRPQTTAQTADPLGTMAVESVKVVNSYDLEGRLTSVVRTVSPDLATIGASTTQTRFDYAGRSVAQVAADGYVDSTAYDLAGNVVTSLSRRNYATTMEYDALNRLTRRILPDVVKLDTTANGWHFPFYALPTLADTATFFYDAMGNLVTANNRDARIKRTYNQNGTLQTDTLKIRTYAELTAGGDTTSHVYGIRHGYDLEARRLYTLVPRQLGARFSAQPTTVYDSVAYSYTNFGALGTARDVLGNVFTFVYDLDGRLERLLYPQGHFKQYMYNRDGMPITIRQDRTSTGGVSAYNEIQAQYDGRGKITGLIPLTSLATYGYQPYQYSAIGPLIGHHQVSPSQLNPRTDNESWTSDAVGNVTSSGSDYNYDYYCCRGRHSVYGSSSTTNGYAPSTARLVAVQKSGGQSDLPEVPGDPSGSSGFQEGRNLLYDRAGNNYWLAVSRRDSSCSSCGGSYVVNTGAGRVVRYYDALSRLRAVDGRLGGTASMFDPSPGFEEYRYDALGRRILRRTRETDGTQLGTNAYHIQRFVWDGDHLVAEMQYPGGNGVTATQLERDTVTLTTESSFFGRVLYLVGETVDQPVSVVRIGYGTTVGGTFKTWEPLGISTHWDHQARGFDQAFYGPTSNCVTVAGSTRCVVVTWPVRQAYGFGQYWSSTWPQFSYGGWYGSLVQDQLDGSGQLFRRNRYYDPATGRFTQEDPIGLAGGLNLYGFAGGDPVNFSDPFGLCPPEKICTRYTFGHLSSISSDVHKGGTVATGQQIAKSGNTGHSTNPHLHYEVGTVDARGNYAPDLTASPATAGCPLASCDNVSSEPAGNRCLAGVCRPHNGTDIAVPEGTPVKAPQGGEVFRAGWENDKDHKQGFGLRVTIDVVRPEKPRDH